LGPKKKKKQEEIPITEKKTTGKKGSPLEVKEGESPGKNWGESARRNVESNGEVPAILHRPF